MRPLSFASGFEGGGRGEHTFGGRGPVSPRATLLLPVVVSLVIGVGGTVFQLGWARMWGAAVWWHPVLALAFAVAGPLLLLAARRLPGPTVAAVLAVTVADVLVQPHVVAPFAAAAFSIVLALARGARLWAFASVAGAWLAGLAGLSLIGAEWPPPRLVATTVGLIVALGAGEFLRTRRQRILERQTLWQRRREDAAAEERVRIARELHDVLAHSLSQISVQAGVGLHLLDAQPEQARTALESIRATSRTALDEVRSVLGVLRADDPDRAATVGDVGSPGAGRAPQPGLASLPGLVASVATPTLTTSFEGDTEVDLPPATQSALYRIAQESLTNAVRHAQATTVVVRLDARPDAVELTVTDDGLGLRDADPGRGMLGMRERAELLGGTLAVQPTEGGGTTVRAVIPRGRP
ncbi:sensor histidine kinase [Cnuibacter sp. UC19_7]|uniref:sensor histidine kinase n=1 Tax=Cnuibacter sp. UC19_7 TaxID=3350166 RepID=UPI003672EEC8